MLSLLKLAPMHFGWQPFLEEESVLDYWQTLELTFSTNTSNQSQMRFMLQLKGSIMKLQ